MRGLLFLFLLFVGTTSDVAAKENIDDSDPFSDPIYDVVRNQGETDNTLSSESSHPLVPVLRYAYGRYVHMRQEIQDYTCTVYRRERIAGRLKPHEVVSAKVRHCRIINGRCVPSYDVYLRYIGPSRIKGREALFVQGNYFNRLIVTRGGRSALSDLTLALNPKGNRALSQNRHPINQFGMMGIAQRLVQRGMAEVLADRHPDEWEIKHLYHTQINDRDCLCIQVRRTVDRAEYSFYLIQAFIDNELQVPVRFTLYSWPRKPGGQPMLDEEYTYTNIRLNVGLVDTDFAVDNPAYHFNEDRVSSYNRQNQSISQRSSS